MFFELYELHTRDLMSSCFDVFMFSCHVNIFQASFKWMLIAIE